MRVLLFVVWLLLTESLFSQTAVRLSERIHSTRNNISNEYEKKNFSFVHQGLTLNGKYVLSSIEQELLCLLQNDYHRFLDLYVKHDKITSVFRGFRYQRSEHDDSMHEFSKGEYNRDLISFYLRNSVIESSDYLINDVRNARLSNHQKEFIIFFIEQLNYVVSNTNDNENQLSRIEKAQDYVITHPTSIYSKYVRQYHSNFYEPSWFAMDFNIGTGTGLLTRNFGDVMTRNWGFDLDMRVYLHSSFVGMRGNVTFNGIREDVVANGVYLSESQGGLPLTFIDFYAGRKFDVGDRFSVLPHMGWSVSELGISASEDANDPVNAISVHYSWGLSYGVDIHYSFSVLQKQQTQFARFNRTMSDSMPYFRLSIVSNDSGIGGVIPNFSGRSIGFNLGVGVHLRAIKKTKMF